jgi:hypothetical protein
VKRAGTVFRLVILGCLLAVNPLAEARTGISLHFGGRSGFDSSWSAEDLSHNLRRLSKEREAWFQEQEKAGAFLIPPPADKVPHWAQGQEIALRERPEMLLVRMNWAGVKAAIAMLKGDLSWEYEDQLGRDLPFGFDAERLGSQILSDFRFSGHSKSARTTLLRREESRLREIFMELRDQIRRDVVQAHHSLEVAQRGKSPQAITRAHWRLLFELGRLVPGKKSRK